MGFAWVEVVDVGGGDAHDDLAPASTDAIDAMIWLASPPNRGYGQTS